MEQSRPVHRGEVEVLDAQGTATGSVDLDPAVFDAPLNVPLIHQVAVAQQAAKRQGTHSTKTRGKVSGGGRKPYKQKGTGRARQGSIRAPQFKGGGVAHGPTPRDYAQRTPKKMKSAALRSALSDRARHDRVHIVTDFGVKGHPRTGIVRRYLDALLPDSDHLVVLTRTQTAEWLSFRNLPQVHVLAVDQLNTYDVIANSTVVFSRAAFDAFMDWQHANLAIAGTDRAHQAPSKTEKPSERPGASSTNTIPRPIELMTTANAELPQEELIVADNSGEYSESETRGYVQRLIDGEYVHSELQSSGSKTVMWSSDLDWPSFLRMAAKSIQLGEDDSALWWMSGDDLPTRGNLSTLLEMNRTQGARVEFCRIIAANVSVVWRQPFQKLEWSDDEHAEVALVSRPGVRLNRGELLGLMSVTGSKAIRAVIDDAKMSLEPVLAVAS